jgi:uncharacterized protein with PIN domain
MTGDELRARLLAEAERIINETLEEKPAASQIRLDEIERLALRTGQEVQASVLKALAEEGSEAQRRGEQRCEQCGSRMQRRGLHTRQVVTEAGEMRLERAYYVCPGCGARLFPPR